MTLLAEVSYTGDSNTTQFALTFEYLDVSHLGVFLDGVAQTTGFTVTQSTITFDTAPATGVVVLFKRVTPIDARIVDFQDGSVLTESDLDKSANQNFFVVQEIVDGVANKMGVDTDNKFDAQNKIIKNVADGSADTDAVNVRTVNSLTSTAVTTVNNAIATVNSSVATVNQAVTDSVTAKNQAEGFKNDTQTLKTDVTQLKADTQTLKDDTNTLFTSTQTLLSSASLPQTLSGNAGKFLQVNNAESSYELVSSVASPKFYGLKINGSNLEVTTSSSGNYNTTDYDYQLIAENVSFQIVNNTLQIDLP